MSWQHLGALLWLRWRLLSNQLRRGGIGNTVLLALLSAAAVVVAVVLFVGFFLVGLLILPEVDPGVLMLVWDGLVVVFLFLWTIGLVGSLQRSEVVSAEKLLHLPVSLTGAFLVNYLSSLLSLTLLAFVPLMVGLTLGLAFGRGPAMLLLLPLVAAFILMVTALTYQFQSWLAALMANQRRRRTVIVLVTGGFILLCQLPNLVNLLQPRKNLAAQVEPVVTTLEEEAELKRALDSGRLTRTEYLERRAAIRTRDQAELDAKFQQKWQHALRTARVVNMALPPGWLPLGAMDLAEGHALPALLGGVGLALIGAASLGRTYRTTVRLYTGDVSSGRRRPSAVTPPPQPTPATARTGPSPVALLERDLPWVSEHAVAVALGGLRSLLRAPEAKLVLLAPIVMAAAFGSILLTRGTTPPAALRPLMGFGATAMILLTMTQLAGNQFGFDRNGFRVFVLCPAPRREILLGKNLALAPLALGLGLVVLAALQAICPLRLTELLAALPQMISMYLLYCLLANFLSLLAPMRVAAASLKAANPKAVPVLLHLAFVVLLPLTLLPALLPLGLTIVLQLAGRAGAGAMLAYPLLSLAVCVAIVLIYRHVLTWQGELLQVREQKILEVVTAGGD